MPYFAAAVVRSADGAAASHGWSASEMSLTDASDVEDVADRLRDLDPGADVSLLFVESDDSYLVIMRLDGGEDLRVFGSDSTFAEESRLGALLLGDVSRPALELETLGTGALEAEALEPDVPELEAEPDESTVDTLPGPIVADVDPAGDADLLADLGVPAGRLLELCFHDGMLPSDVTAELCQAIGCGDEIEELREA
jgi:putative tRNA adenosine deaminase-associated protein